MIKEVLIFVAGAGIGAGSAAFFLKRKYSAKAEEEIASVRDAFSAELESLKAAKAEEQTNKGEDQPKEPEKVVREDPYAITSEEYHENKLGYFQEMLFYYADEVVANINDEKIDPDKTIGREALKILDEGMGDVIYIRNEKLETEWEINNDPRTFKEVTEAWSDESDGDDT